MDHYILEINALTKYYGKTRGVENLNLQLKKGEIFGFIGPNGAGKSTTIRTIMQLLNKTSGEIKIFGEEVTKDNLEMKQKIGYLPSEIHLYDDLKVKDILNYHQSFYKEDLTERRKILVHRLKLDENKKIEDLSLGNLKKVGIVLALMHHPELLILDEPTSGLDPIIQNVFYDLLLEEKAKGTTILYSTHILSEVTKICDRVGIIKDGCLITTETIENLKNKQLGYVTITSCEVDKIITDLHLEDAKLNQNTIRFKNSLKPNELMAKLIQYDISKILIEDMDLEDMFLHYYK